mmetsp:Transcript_46581/g.98853  ORF Transcript_46581/g.98853 Transcript_46581/m.98853 type:complete len:239 (+) Transcript_46581:1984-2700(+)
MSMLRYTFPLSSLESELSWVVLDTSLLSVVTTSLTFLDVTSVMATSRTFLHISGLGELKALRMSCSNSCKILECFFCSSPSLSSTIIMTLLSFWELRRLVYVTAAARTAVGELEREMSVQAASYETAAESLPNIWNRTRTKRDFWLGSRRHALRVRSRTRRAKPSPNLETSSRFLAKNWMASSSDSLYSMRNALRRAPTSVSAEMNASTNSGPSGMRASPWVRCAWNTASTAFLRTYW